MNLLNDIKKILKVNKKPWEKFYPKDKRKIKVPEGSLYEYIREKGNDHMDNIAINYFGNTFSYSKFFHEIDLCARALVSQGIRKDDVVSICMANTPEAVISFYAVSKIGAIANMIHPLSSEQEIKHSLNSTHSVMLIAINICYENIKSVIDNTTVYKVVIVSPKDSMPPLTGFGYFLLQDRKIHIPSNSEKFVKWKDFMDKGLKYSQDVEVKRKKDDPAVILHSGGTTGTPKNIVLTNGNINVVPEQAIVALPDIDDSDRMLCILPMFHCFGLVETIHFPTATGLEMILIPKFDAKEFDKIILKNKPTIIPGVPTLFEALIKNSRMQGVDMSFVKYIVSGGDTLPPEKNIEVNHFLKEHNCKHNIVQGYGLTETSGGVIFPTTGTDIPGCSGIPLPGNDIKIIDVNTHEEVGPNENGELLISGPSVMLGYLDNEKETNEILEKDSKGKIWVHTGDMGHINEDGIFFFVQRIKRLIIVSGYNVFPSHIEDVLEKNKYVSSSCVIGVPHPYKIQVPKAFIVLKPGYKDKVKIRKEIKEYCEKNLARYMIPKEFVFRESLPKTMIGKVDFKKLEEENANT